MGADDGDDAPVTGERGHADPVGAAALAAMVDDWQPSDTIVSDDLLADTARRFAVAVSGQPREFRSGDPLPWLWHWAYFLDAVATTDLGIDGHPKSGGFLPPLPDRTRMFVGGRVVLLAPLLIGATAERHSALSGAVVRTGRTGPTVLVTVRHDVRQNGRLCVRDEQDLLYWSGQVRRPPADKATVGAPRTSSLWQQEWCGDPVTLFRFSAATANTHRIHYDHPYATEREGYPDLVVHGPLLVLLMLQMLAAHRPATDTGRIDYRLERPVFAGERVLLTGAPSPEDGAELAVLSGDSRRHATASVANSVDGPSRTGRS